MSEEGFGGETVGNWGETDQKQELETGNGNVNVNSQTRREQGYEGDQSGGVGA
jgi:hypothetical protein